MNLTHGDHSHEVHVSDDGSLDTVITVDGIEVRYSEAERHADGSVKARWLANAAREACDDGLLEDDSEDES
jgi:hypothetical protein